MKSLCERIDEALDNILMPLSKTPYSEIKESIKEENLPVSFFAREAIENGLVSHYGSWYITEKGKELLGKFKEIFTEREFIKENFFKIKGGFPIRTDEFIGHGIEVCRKKLFEEKVLDKKQIEETSVFWGIRVNTFLFVLVVFAINKAIEEKILLYI